MGAEAVRDAAAQRWTSTQLIDELQEEMRDTKSQADRKKLAKRLKIIQGFRSIQEPPGVDDPRRAAR